MLTIYIMSVFDQIMAPLGKEYCYYFYFMGLFSFIQCSIIMWLWYKYRNQVHFEWYFRWCLGIPKHIETPTIFRNIIFHEFPLNMEYSWYIHGVSAFLISRFSRSVISLAFLWIFIFYWIFYDLMMNHSF